MSASRWEYLAPPCWLRAPSASRAFQIMGRPLSRHKRRRLERPGQLRRPPPGRAHRPRERDHLFLGHAVRHHGRAVEVELDVADLAGDLRAEPAPAGLHPLDEQTTHLVELLVGDAIRLRVVHTRHIRVEGGQRDERHDVHALWRAVHAVEEFGIADPVPRHAGAHRLERHRFVARHRQHRPLTVVRLAGSETEATVADDHAGHAVPARHRAPRVPEHLAVVVRVEVDEPGRHDLAARRRPPHDRRTRPPGRSARPAHRRSRRQPCTAASAGRR